MFESNRSGNPQEYTSDQKRFGKTNFARAVDCSIEQQSTARLFGSRSCRMVPVNHPAQMNSNPNCRSFASGSCCPAGCNSSLGNAPCVPALKLCIPLNWMRCFSAAGRSDRYRSAAAEHSHIEYELFRVCVYSTLRNR